jgi:phosphoribosylanthranilate isomerase
MLMKIKICGITRTEDADYSLKSGADFVGVILDPRVKRHGHRELIREIKQKHPSAMVVGVYTSMPEYAGHEDYIQLHFSHSPEDIAFVKNVFHKKVISVIDFNENHIQEKINSHIEAGAEYVLLEDRTGIEKRKSELMGLTKIKIGIAGKIDKDNVQSLLETNPELVDVSSSLEETVGKKSFTKIDEFFDKLGEYHAVRQN